MQRNISHSAFQCPPARWKHTGEDTSRRGLFCAGCGRFPIPALCPRLFGSLRPEEGGSPLGVAHGALEGHRAPAEPLAFCVPSPSCLPLAQERCPGAGKGSAAKGLHRKSGWVQGNPRLVPGSAYSTDWKIMWEVSFLWLVQSFQGRQNITKVQTTVLELAWLTTA